MILQVARSVYEMVFENRVTKAFLRAIPGLDDYALLGKAWFHTTEEKRGKPVWDTVVFDMPASGHSVSMLRVPWVIIDTVPEGPLTRDARTIKELLCDPARTAAVLVTLAEEMPVNEAIELEAKLTALGIVPQQMRRATRSIPITSRPARRSRACSTRWSPTPRSRRRSPSSPRTRSCRAIAARSTRATSPSCAARAKTRSRELPMLFAPTLGPARDHQRSARQLAARLRLLAGGAHREQRLAVDLEAVDAVLGLDVDHLAAGLAEHALDRRRDHAVAVRVAEDHHAAADVRVRDQVPGVEPPTRTGWVARYRAHESCVP